MFPESNEKSTFESPSGIFGTSVTLEYLEKKLQKVLNTLAKFGSSVSVEQFGCDQGFLSVMVRLKPDWQGGTIEELPNSFVVKIPSSAFIQLVSKQSNWEKTLVDKKVNMKDQFKSFDDVLKMAHACEMTFYNLVKKDHLKVKVPKCYYADYCGSKGESGLLIMEDMGEIAAVKPAYEVLSIKSVKAVLDNVAELHAYSLLNDQWLSNPNLKMTFAKFQKESRELFHSMTIGNLEMLKREHAALFDPLINRLLEICQKDFNLEYIDTIHEQLGLPPVLTHGDLWRNNIMWRKTEDGKSTTDELAAIVDWQLVHPGCVGEDLVRLFCSSVDTNVRREHFGEFMQYYHSSLKSKLGKDLPFTVAQLVNAYKRVFRYGVVMILPCFGGFAQSEMGTENFEQHMQELLNRAKCLIEDLYELEDELARENA